MPATAKIAASPANRHARRSAKHRAGAVNRFAAAFGMEAPKETDDEKASRRAEEDKRKDGESDEDYESRKAANKAEWDKEDKEASEEEDETEMSETEDEKCAAARAEGFAAGGARWSDTLSATEAKGKGLSAMSLLANTEMTSEQIRAALAGLQPDAVGGTAAADGLSRRMAAERVVPPTPGGTPAAAGAAGEPLKADSIIAAAALIRGETPKAA